MSLSSEERKKTILERLDTDEKVEVLSLAELLSVSAETVRRDLERLEKEGRLKKVYGGAVKAKFDAWELPFDQKTFINSKEKTAIGKMAASLVEDGDIIMIGNGTTPLEIVRFLSGKRNITIITHSAPVMLLAMEVTQARIIFIGGEVHTSQKSTNGPLAEWMLKKLKANKVFISAGGVSSTDGISDYDLDEANISGKMIERADETIVLADHTKFDKTTFANICPLEGISKLISDWNCPKEWSSVLDEIGVELLIAPENKNL